MANNNRNLTLKTIQEPPVWNCPHCGRPSTGFKWEDGETVELDKAPSHCAAAMMWGTCTDCGKELYLLEVGIAPGLAGEQFLLDYGWKDKWKRLNVAESRSMPVPWLLTEYRDNTGVSVIDGEGRITNRDTFFLDVHVFEGWSAAGRYEACCGAQALAHELLSFCGELRTDH